ncbi:chemotaxis protein CheD [Paramaledivibacter caminithermalis]|jgi:chemotaxis protein CheD|uniref:Probable chemoreceptor glutamine deamidase CheD n=1 Tax=Paramaledivibacter caminithermalis (strain DSM 15212 / CIP 107654 / DViRD3) TaxID=1121301 RepID=A0A1M6N6L3_PARC5|nr:chemotaxis protein CheD [Paramaledivibacter caminithermalis]SHJ91263.1 chemotaxis protein CheD [Paramaledivibacter caminithermalis DSM 15212]
MDNIVKVGMADLKTTFSPKILTTLGLGSCVGICLYDPVKKVAGMAHIMLPDSKNIRNNSNLFKFADTGIDALIDEMVKKGASKYRLISKIAGGSQMFSFASKNDIMKIGERNVIAVKKILNDYNIPIKAQDTGGNYGRTIEFHSIDGKLLVKTIGHGIKEL